MKYVRITEIELGRNNVIVGTFISYVNLVKNIKIYFLHIFILYKVENPVFAWQFQISLKRSTHSTLNLYKANNASHDSI